MGATGNLCNKSPRTRHNFFVGCDDFLECCSQEFLFGSHADSIVQMNLLHVL